MRTIISTIILLLIASSAFAQPTWESLNQQYGVLTGIKKEISILQSYERKAARRINTLKEEYAQVYKRYQRAASRSEASQVFSMSTISSISSIARGANSSNVRAQRQIENELDRIKADHVRWYAEYTDLGEQIRNLFHKYDPLVEQYKKELKEYEKS